MCIRTATAATGAVLDVYDDLFYPKKKLDPSGDYVYTIYIIVF